MSKFTFAAVLAVLLLAVPAFAQVASPYGESPMNMNTGWHQTQESAMGKILEIDLSRHVLTLDTGTEFTLAPSLEYTSFPALGQEVQVTYTEQGGQKVAQEIDILDSRTPGGSNQ